MTLIQRIGLWIALLGALSGAFQPQRTARALLHASKLPDLAMSKTSSLRSVPGADIEQPPVEEESPRATSSASSSAIGSIQMPSKGKGKVNEIDFCIAPADASISRAYGTTVSSTSVSTDENGVTTPLLSLTRALNNASNRAVRRILLARSWPSAEALNLSLRQVAAAEREASMRLQEQQQEAEQQASSATSANANDADEEKQGDEDLSAPKCPVPRPILNVLTRKRGEDVGEEPESRPLPRGRTDEEYVQDQLAAFKDRYGSLPGYDYAEAYLDSILSLATSGLESARATEVLESGVYDDAYRRIKAVLRTVGAVFIKDEETGRPVIATKLIDQDICLSMLDKLNIRKERSALDAAPALPTVKSVATQKVTEAPKSLNSQISESERIQEEAGDDEDSDIEIEDGVEVFKPKLNKFFRKKSLGASSEEVNAESDAENNEEEETSLSRDDLGGVLLSAEEPTMTRQLNVLSNIVQRALLFGGDQELLVLSETLDADRAAFVERWYSGTGDLVPYEEETRPGVQYLNCLIALLRNCYNEGIVTNLQPPLPLGQSYANAYERLVATSVELGSGYLKPEIADILTMPSPRTATEELGRFAVWETTFRQQKSAEGSAYPPDFVGQWEVRDEIGGETIGTSQVRLGEEGEVELAEPLEGLRWRCDPGPTHLDTCTFQVLSSDGTILQYRGFVDRGSRLESRVSKRPIKIRGKVMFQMRDGSVDYFKDMLPINYRQGTTSFVMTKIVEER